MLVCPQCFTTYAEGGASVCPQDGAGLLPLDERCGTVVGNYRLIGLLGRGGMGVVYRAVHVYIDKPVAIKILHERFARHDEAVQRFLREARAATLIAHPNIVDVTDFGVGPDGGVYLVMEYLDGKSLARIVDEEAPLPLIRTINITHQIARALGAAHEKGIIHRDLKPENVLVIPRPGRRELVFAPPGAAGVVVEPERTFDFVKVLDFGVAKVREIDEPGRSGTMAGTIFGTPQYIAPEQARAEPIDRRADIYALGIVVYEMLTREVPFEAPTPIEVLALQIREQPRPPSQVAPPGAEVTPAIERLILRALEKDPGRRPQSMAAFCDELQSCYGGVRYRRDAHSMPGPAAAGLEPRGPWSRAPAGEEPPSRLRPKRLTEELRALLDPLAPSGPITPEPRRRRLTEELQQLLTPAAAADDAPALIVEPAHDLSAELTRELGGEPASEPGGEPASELVVEAVPELVVEPVEPIPATELSSRIRLPATPTPAPTRTARPATSPAPEPPPPPPPGVRSPASRTAAGHAVVSLLPPPPAAPPAAAPLPPAAAPSGAAPLPPAAAPPDPPPRPAAPPADAAADPMRAPADLGRPHHGSPDEVGGLRRTRSRGIVDPGKPR